MQHLGSFFIRQNYASVCLPVYRQKPCARVVRRQQAQSQEGYSPTRTIQNWNRVWFGNMQVIFHQLLKQKLSVHKIFLALFLLLTV